MLRVFLMVTWSEDKKDLVPFSENSVSLFYETDPSKVCERQAAQAQGVLYTCCLIHTTLCVCCLHLHYTLHLIFNRESHSTKRKGKIIKL